MFHKEIPWKLTLKSFFYANSGYREPYTLNKNKQLYNDNLRELLSYPNVNVFLVVKILKTENMKIIMIMKKIKNI